MTDSTSPAPSPQAAPFLQAWTESVARVLGQIAGSPSPCIVVREAPAGIAPYSDGDSWIAGTFTGSLRGEMSLRLPPSSILQLARTIMGGTRDLSEAATAEAAISGEAAAGITAGDREAVLELLRQVAGLVASALKASWGEVQLHLEPSASAPSWPASSTSWLRAGGDPAAALIEVQLSAALVAALRVERTESAKSAMLSSASVPAAGEPRPEPGKVKLDLLMDVELAVTLRFGSRRLLLREVLDLIPGAVVDLDRQVHEPVDVLLDGRLLARGEVVVVDGNYGVRVTEVAPANS
ncbi:MAG TPA: flagellar motor switch protein FliN [Candidatus Sulfotelmatobacter sp.]